MRRLCGVLAVLVVVLALVSLPPARAQDGDASASLLAKADQITSQVAKLRGLAPKRAVKKGVMNKAQLTERLLKRIHEEYTPAQIAGESLALKRFGLLPADADYLKVVTELLVSQIAGFYDPFAGELFLADWVSLGADTLMAHEIDHALQDQHFDLKRYLLGVKDNADATAARQAVIEGDGTALMMEHLLAGMGKSAPWGEEGFAEQAASMTAAQASQMKGVPFALREALIFPYSDGLRFVAHFRKHHGWDRIDEMFARPPLSTEHILHPELYVSYQKPVDIKATLPPVIRDYKLAFDNVSGEKGLAVMLEAHGLSHARAVDAAAGWGGDRTALFTPPDHSGEIAGTIGVLVSTWDEPIDAIEFFDGLSHVLPSLADAKKGQFVADDPSGVIRYRNRNGAVVSATREGSNVLLLVGAPPAREPELRRAALSWSP